MTPQGYFISIGSLILFVLSLILCEGVISKQIDKAWTIYGVKSKTKTILFSILYGVGWFVCGCCLEVLIFALSIYI